MKKVTLLTLFFAALMISSNVMAQDSKFRGSAGIALGTKSDVDDDGESKLGFGINLGVEYLVNEQISIAPSYTIFFPSDPLSLTAFNLDGRYYFAMDDTEFYGLVGYTSLTASTDFLGVKLSTTDGGLNLGGGANFGLGGNLKLNTQIKYQTAGDGQLVINGGVVIAF